MKKIVFAILFICSGILLGQNIDPIEKPYIEVIGTAEKKVTPDQIYVLISLSEKTVNKKRISVQEQEEKLYQILNTLNIGKENLQLSNTSSSINWKRSKEKGIKLSKSFILMLRNGKEVSDVFKALSANGIKEALISKTEHSDIINIRKEVRVEAIKAAKEKASYLLTAIDEELGKPMIIREQPGLNPYSGNNFIVSNQASLYAEISPKENYDTAEFKKIEVKYSYYVKYEIK